MRFATAAAAFSILCLAAWSAQAPGPLTQAELVAMLRQIEAARPSEEIAALIQQRTVAFEMTPAVRSELQTAATRRPPDLVRVVLDNAALYGPTARLRKLAFGAGDADANQRRASLEGIAAWLRERGAPPRNLAMGDWPEPAVALVLPPVEPPKPPFPDQLWRTARAGVPAAPLDYDAYAARGSAELDLTVDGRVMIVVKHQTVYYNVICGEDLEVRGATFTQPLPRVPLDQLRFVVETPAKPRGAVFACPADPRCRKSDRQCPWTDVGETNDDRGYPAVRFLVDDPQRGRAGYKVALRWALEPLRFEDVAGLLKRSTPELVTAQLFSRGASFTPNDAQDADLRRLGATDKLLSTLRANQRKTNPIVR